MKDLFKNKLYKHELRNKKLWEVRNVRTDTYGTETVSFMGPKIWELIPNDIKNLETLQAFKREIKLWKPSGCPCKLCKSFIPELGYL